MVMLKRKFLYTKEVYYFILKGEFEIPESIKTSMVSVKQHLW